MLKKDFDINKSEARSLAARLLDYTGYKGIKYYEMEDAFTEVIREFLTARSKR